MLEKGRHGPSFHSSAVWGEREKQKLTWEVRCLFRLSLEVEFQTNERKIKNDLEEPKNTGDVISEESCVI